jgi:serine protease AprX
MKYRCHSIWLLVLTIAPMLLAQDGGGKIASDIPDSGSVKVIVQYAGPPNAARHRKVTSRGGSLDKDLSSINGASYTLQRDQLNDLASDPDVVRVTADHEVRAMMEFANPAVNANIALKYGFDGTGIGIAVLDSGVDEHQDLRSLHGNRDRIVYSESFVPGVTGTNDNYGHGTHVAGVAGGDGDLSDGPHNSYTFRGIAPNAFIVNLKVLDADGNGTDSAVIAGIERAVALKTRYNIRVINLSLGRPITESYRIEPIRSARRLNTRGRMASWS